MKCRLCNHESDESEGFTKLSDEVLEEESFRTYLKTICHIELSDDERLPQSVCSICKDFTDQFGMFVEKIMIQEEENLASLHTTTCGANDLIMESDDSDADMTVSQLIDDIRNEPVSSTNMVDHAIDRLETDIEFAQEMKYKIDPVDASIASAVQAVPAKFQGVSLKKEYIDLLQQQQNPEWKLRQREFKKNNLMSCGGRNSAIGPCSHDVEDIFKFDTVEMRNSYASLDATDMKIAKEFPTWKDFKYECQDHCSETFISLQKYLKHFNQMGVAKVRRSIKCFECGKIAKGPQCLTSHINHLTSKHIKFINFCCIICSEMSASIPQLMRHYKQTHQFYPIIMYPCFCCGRYFNGTKALLTHKRTHFKKTDPIIISDSEYDSDQTETYFESTET